jgi:hypothetical protein
MKKQTIGIIAALILIGFIISGCLSTAVQNDLRKDFFGTWHYPETNIFYTITDKTLEAYMPGDNTGFTARISNWKYIKNSGPDKSEYPAGYIITATMEKMTGSWWIDVGETDTWTWYISNDINRIVTANGVLYYKR